MAPLPNIIVISRRIYKDYAMNDGDGYIMLD